jgi:hypothetical protein
MLFLGNFVIQCVTFPVFPFWCLWRRRNDRNFEDKERMPGKIISMFFETFYLWTAAYVSSLLINYSDFFCLFCSIYLSGFFCIFPVYLGLGTFLRIQD